MTKSANDRPGGTGTLAGRPVARIGFGAMQLPGPGVWGPPRDRDTAVAVLRTAVELGVNHIDTAQYYGPDVANDLIRAALHPYPDDLVLVSKVGAERDAQGGWNPAQRPEQLRAGVEANLRSLAIERLGAVNLRLPGGAGEPGVDLDSQLAEMVALRDEGKIAGIGISNVTADQLRRALPVGLVCVQNPYSLLDRSGEPLLQLCREHDLAWVPFFPLGSAFPGSAQSQRTPRRCRRGRRARRHARASRPGVAPRPRRACVVDRGHVESRPSDREHRGRQCEARRGHDGRPRSPRKQRRRASHVTLSAGDVVRSLARLRFGEVVGKFGGRVADLVEDVEQRLLSLRADAINEQARHLLDRGQRFVQHCLRGRGDVDEHPATVIAVAAAHDVLLPFEVVEQ